MTLAVLGLFTSWGPDWQAGGNLMRVAADMADRVGDPHAMAFVSWYVVMDRGDLGGSRTLAIAREHGLTEWIGPGLMQCMTADLGRGQRTHAEQDLTELLETARRLGSPFQNAMALVAQASFAYLDGQLDEGRAISRRALEAGRQAMGDRQARWYFGLWSVQEMGRLLDQGRAVALETGSRAAVAAYPTVPAWRAALAMVLALSGKTDEARTEVDSFTADRDHPLQEGVAGPAVLAFLVRAAVALDDRVTAAQLAEAAESVRQRRRCIVISNAPVPALFFGAVAHYQGLLAGLLERHEDTDRFFAEALEIHERMASPPWIARTQAEWAQFLIHREPERARQMLAAAEAICRPLGLTDVLNQIDSLTGP